MDKAGNMLPQTNPVPHQASTDTSRKNTLVLSFTLLVVMLGYGMIQPILPFLITKLGASGSGLGVLASVYALMQLVCAPVWGNLSDRVGRKPVLLIGVLGYAIAMFIFGLSTRFWMLFLARTFSGVLSSAAMPTAMAYLSDSLPEKERSGAMGKLGAAVGLGVVLGPLLGGFLSSTSLSLPFFVGSALSLAALGLIQAFLPESHPAGAASTSARQENFWQWAALQRILLGPAGVLMLLILIISFAMTNFQGIVGLYAMQRFDFNTRQVGAIWMVVGGVMILGQGVLSGRLAKRYGELRIIRLSMLLGALGFFLLLLAQGFIPFLAATAFFLLAVALIGPALNAYLSTFGGEHQGSLMGLNTAFASLGRVFGPLWAGFSFDVNIFYPFISGAVAMLIGFSISLLYRPQASPP
jgi:DHA1 family multidrug resistance protein-like MFS transporter